MARILAIILMLAVAGAITVSVATAKGNPHNGTEQKPGWGNGDKNHEHTGPGGTSVRPGNGFGDQNHTHTGPPGQQ